MSSRARVTPNDACAVTPNGTATRVVLDVRDVRPARERADLRGRGLAPRRRRPGAAGSCCPRSPTARSMRSSRAARRRLAQRHQHRPRRGPGQPDSRLSKTLSWSRSARTLAARRRGRQITRSRAEQETRGGDACTNRSVAAIGSACTWTFVGRRLVITAPDHHRHDGEVLRRSTCAAWSVASASGPRSPGSTCPSSRARSMRCSAPTARARPPCCAPSPGWWSRPRAPSASSGSTPPRARAACAGRSGSCRRATARPISASPGVENLAFFARLHGMRKKAGLRPRPRGARRRRPRRPRRRPRQRLVARHAAAALGRPRAADRPARAADRRGHARPRSRGRRHRARADRRARRAAAPPFCGRRSGSTSCAASPAR